MCMTRARASSVKAKSPVGSLGFLHEFPVRWPMELERTTYETRRMKNINAHSP
ncbi:hypothetical protein AWB80_03121 [Caballeronia pedi]|uniref:Uncharacterized protein n=1 Tax=Caballeronia pedi TaxID=1777141 RepID=A0A158B7C0_9BURK|nr:hypothetical protein AWB80_03121 [Caballeronia pedi]